MKHPPSAKDRRTGKIVIIVAIIAAAVLCVLLLSNANDCVQIEGQWYCGPEARKIEQMNKTQQRSVKKEIDARESEEKANKNK